MRTSRNVASKATTLLALLLVGCFSGSQKARILERADKYFKAGDYDKAKIEYLNLLRLDNRNVTAFQQLGYIWSEQGVPLRAVPFLFQVRELAPQNVPARVKLGLALQEVGQLADARKEAVAILERDPANLEAIVLLAEASRSKEEIASANEQIQKFPNKNTAAFHLASATLAGRRNDMGAAADEVQQAVATEPNSARAHLAKGYLYMLRKDQERAGSELKAAADLAPLRSVERIQYAQFQGANGAADQAKASLQAITKGAPDYIPAWRDLARIALVEKKSDEALSILENIFGRDPENPEARMLQAEALLAKGDSKKAIETLDKVDAAYPDNPLVKYALGRVYLTTNSTNQATIAFDQALAARPDYPEATLALAELNLRAGKAQLATQALENLLKKHPDLEQARVLLAGAYQTLGRSEDAAALLREQIKMTPQSADAYILLGTMLRQQTKNDEARQAFEKSLELMPNNFNSINQLVEMDLLDKRYEAAAQRVEQQLTKHPEAAASHFLEAKVYIAHATARDLNQAEAELEKALQLDANFAPAYNLLVSLYVVENKLPEAIGKLKTEIERQPSNPSPLLLSGVIYERMKDYANARDTYQKALNLSPDSILGLNNLAVLYGEQLNQLDKAYELAQKAHTLDPGNGMVADTLGWILYKRGNYQQALALLQDSASKFADNPEVQFHLGMASSMMGQGDAARLALERAVQSTTDFPGKAEAQQRLAALKGSAGSGTKDLSVGELESHLKQQPNDVMALAQLGEAYEKDGNLAKAATAYEQALKLNPKLLGTVLKLAQLYVSPLHQPDKALELAKKARELAPNDPQTAGTVGRIAFQAGNFNWAYSLLQESARRSTDDPGVLHDLAMSAYFIGKVSEARQTMERALKAKPDTSQAEDGRRFLAMTGLDQPSTDVTAAQSEIEKTLKEKPDYLPALMAQASLQLHRNDTKAAASIYSDALRKYPDFAPAQKHLAGIYVDDPENLGKAYDLAMKARKTLSNDPELARTLAELSFKRNEFSYAVQLFQESNAKQPLLAKDLFYLGMAQLQSRQEAAGRKTLEQALSRGLSDPFAQEAKKRLAEQQPK